MQTVLSLNQACYFLNISSTALFSVTGCSVRISCLLLSLRLVISGAKPDMKNLRVRKVELFNMPNPTSKTYFD